jgi:hypothetical protein
MILLPLLRALQVEHKFDFSWLSKSAARHLRELRPDHSVGWVSSIVLGTSALNDRLRGSPRLDRGGRADDRRNAKHVTTLSVTGAYVRSRDRPNPSFHVLEYNKLVRAGV